MTEKRRRLPSQRTILMVAAGLLLAGLVWVLGPGARWVVDLDVDVTQLPEKDLATAADAVRGRALAIATGLVALAAVYYTARNAETARRAVELTQQTSTRTLELTEQGQVTDRYTKAIQQLGDSENLHIRIGGIYALERIARDSERDHSTVQEVLTAFVREYAPEPEQSAAEEGATQVALPRKVPADVQASLTVLGRANMLDANLTGAYLARAELPGADLSRAKLTGADLINAKLTGAKLTGADLAGADLTAAMLGGANLAGARLADADLTGATLGHADLPGTDLTYATLTGANLTGASLTGANLAGADLTDAKLIGARLVGAKLTGACLAGADLAGARLTRAQFESAAAKQRASPPARFLDDPPQEQAESS
ncbi:uncharacterized protein YjbI with pentapeptide repeats [Nonomuraea fuscirosea]|uniref:Uncharacterized protein YjbI with pentapeptide repeats n=1 Tax=Nonomuraea fuscirosea TaxID=1291556 RepID=A0A2T0N2J4_9ACTN|nr:pentapeptide repeat-containing protein [Nonomuraea fuscirosea]PRX66194.1 uncharacterized protein YjbI with pentapeptide repeats [Nonomuraea fuscirosea]